MLFHLLPFDKVKPLNEWERSLLLPDMYTPLNPLSRTAIRESFRSVGSRRVRNIDHRMRL